MYEKFVQKNVGKKFGRPISICKKVRRFENENRMEMCEKFFNLEKNRKLKVLIQKIVRK